jgi:hypothetical protein
VRVIQEIYRQLPGEPGTRRNEVLVAPTVEALSAHLASPGAIRDHIRVYGQIDAYERALSRLLDEGGRVDADQWQRLADGSQQGGCLMMAAQALRGVGLAKASATPFEHALEIAQSASARPLAARLMIELGQVRGDATLRQAGVATLRQIGDLEYLERGRFSA